ncbi:MAG: hypothetical protein RH947_12975 [Alcanivorax sp.]|tara:strand:- start:3803 stop:4030 length:228 start_codon:yes stop_codon:yes gene_type:complete
MILPSKHISEDQALIGVGAVLLRNLKRPQTATALWESARQEKSVGTYERFVLALDLLYITGIIHFSQGMIEKVEE